MKSKNEFVGTIVLYPNGTLRIPCKPITNFNEDLKAFCRQLSIICHKTEAYGLSAPQVGKSVNVIAINVDQCPLVDEFGFVPGDCDPNPVQKQYKRKRSRILINPVISDVSTETFKYKEGCLSFPGIFGWVTRPSKFTVTFQDENGKTCVEKIEDTSKDIYGIIVQHEIDHLNGVLMIDRMSEFEKNKLIGKINKLRRK